MLKRTNRKLLALLIVAMLLMNLTPALAKTVTMTTIGTLEEYMDTDCTAEVRGNSYYSQGYLSITAEYAVTKVAIKNIVIKYSSSNADVSGESVSATYASTVYYSGNNVPAGAVTYISGTYELTSTLYGSFSTTVIYP